MRHRPRAGAASFSLVELLAAVAILAVLASLAFPAFDLARGQARQIACVNNLRQLSLAFSLYRNDHDNHFPSSGIISSNRWLNQLIPYVQANSTNANAYAVPLFHCPLTPRSAYAVQGVNGCYGINGAIAPYQNTPGLGYFAVQSPSTKVLLGELSYLRYKETPYNTPAVIDGTAPYPASPYGAAANHRRDLNPDHGPSGPSNYLFCDGHVETLTNWPGAAAFNPAQ